MKTGNGAVCSNVRVFPPGRLSRDSLCRRWDSGWRSTNRVTASRRAESIFDMAWWLKSLWDIMYVGYILWLYMSGEIPSPFNSNCLIDMLPDPLLYHDI